MAVERTNVIDFTVHRTAAAPQPLREVETYWESLREGRLVPERADLDPRGFSSALGHTCLLERIAPGLARIRVAGRHLSDLMGIDVQGLPFTSLFLPEARPRVIETLSAVFEEPAIGRLRLTSPAGISRQELTAELVLLPLRDDMGDITRAVGCLVTEGHIGRTPRRFTVDSGRHQTLIGFGRRPRWPTGDDEATRPAKPATTPEHKGEVVWLSPRTE